jgi:FAD/FMN-containing dehydrogenase
MSFTLNDVHSQLNPTTVAEVRRPQTRAELAEIIRECRQRGLQISVAGGRHAMGGQQFASASLHLDMTALDRVLDADPARGLVHLEAGADWPKIIAASHRLEASSDVLWGIRQKQTGVDAVTLGGSISANAHGRGLLMQPLGGDIENLTLINADGEIVLCSRTENPELFALVIGGYGLFGIGPTPCNSAPTFRAMRNFWKAPAIPNPVPA